MSDQSPAPGWYPDPADPAQYRYWDGTGWTAETTGWGMPTGWRSEAPTGPVAPTYAPATGVLTSSGMRRLSALFDDVGRIIRLAWWQLLVVGLSIWAAATVIVVALTVSAIDFAALDRALDVTQRTAESTGQRSSVIETQLRDAWSAVPRINSPAVWIAIGLVIALILMFASCLQIAATNRLGIDAAAGQPVRLGPAWRSGFIGGVRLLGYSLLWLVVLLVLTAAWVALIALTGSVVPVLAVLVGVLGFFGLIVLTFLIAGRFAPLTVQVLVGPGALRWSWAATRGKFWAVLGRALLWSIVASIVSQIVLSVVFIPFSLFGMGLVGTAVATPGSGPLQSLVATLAVSLLSLPLTMVMAALSYIGIVPIWRDLTDDPVYRSIDDAGQPITPVA